MNSCLRTALFLLLNIAVFFPVNGGATPVALILDTDISSDVDDVGAVAVLHALADQGGVEILAMMVSSGDPWSAGCLDALNTFYGRPDIPIGVVEGESVIHESRFTREIAHQFPNDFGIEQKKQTAVALYRKILASSSSRSVIIVSVGYLTNLSHLLQSKSDSISKWEGKTLVREKVKELICMGGQYPSGREWNFLHDAASAADVVENWPTPIGFVGFESGVSVLTGSGLKKTAKNNPLRKSYQLYNGLQDRPSWDQMAVLFAVEKRSPSFDLRWAFVHGKNRVLATGFNLWRYVPDGPHDHLRLIDPPDFFATRIEELMSSSLSVPAE